LINNNEKFRNNREMPLEMSTLIRFNRRRISNESIIFIEGFSDLIFYSNIGHSKLSKSEYIFRSNKEKDTADDRIQGKEAVLFSYNKIKQNRELSKDLYKCTFIVDYDFNGITSQRTYLSDNDKNRITTTIGHSVENYFVYKNSLDNIFDYLDLDKKHINKFKDILKEFSKDTTEYFALKGAIVYTYKIKSPVKYRKKYSDGDIFVFEITNDYKLNFKTEYMNYEVLSMKNSINSNRKAIDRYIQIKQEIKDNPEKIRGHNIFDLLEVYLLKVIGKSINYNSNKYLYKKLISLLSFDMDLKLMDGEILKIRSKR